MYFSSFRDMKAAKQLLFSAPVAIAAMLIFTLLSVLLGMLFFGPSEFLGLISEQDLSSSSYQWLLRLMQGVSAIGVYGVTPLVLAYLYSKSPKKYLYINSFRGKQLFLSILFFISCYPLISLIGVLNLNMQLPEWLSGVELWMKQSEQATQAVINAMASDSSFWAIVANVFVIAVIAAIAEELSFRGALQRIFIKMTSNIHWGVILSALVFSAIHMQFYGFFPRFLLGLVFGYIVVFTGSIWIPIILHFINNSLALAVEYYKVKIAWLPDFLQDSTTAHINDFALTDYIVVILCTFFASYLYSCLRKGMPQD